MRRRKPRQTLPAPTEDEYRRYLASQLVAGRIARGLTPEAVLEKFGYRYKDAPRAEKRGLNAQKWAVYRLAVLENSLHDTYLSTLQRYARAIGVELRPRIVRPNPGRLQRLKMRRVHRKGVQARRTLRKNRKAGRL